MSEIKVFNKQNHKLDETTQSSTVSLSKASVVVVAMNLDDLVQIQKDKNNAILVTKSGEQINLVNYFNYGNINTSNSLVLQDAQNRLIWAKFSDSNGRVLDNIEYAEIEDLNALYEPSSGFSPWLWVALPVVGAGVYLLTDNKKDSGSSSPPDIVDSKVEAPKISPINANDLITGKAEANSTVSITFPNGVKKTATADSAGNWSIENPGLKDGDFVYATTTNKNGYVSETAKQVVDTVAPTLKISVSDVNLSAGKEVEVTFTFSEAVKNFDLRSITVTGGSLAKLSSKDNKIWTAVFTQKGSDDPSIKVADDRYSDLAGNKGKGDHLDKTTGDFHTDLIAPLLEISASKGLLVSGDAVTITFKFSEAVKAFELEDIAVTGGQISGLSTKDSITWTAVFTQKGSETLSIKVADNNYTDLAGNQGKGAILDQSHGGWGMAPAVTKLPMSIADVIASAEQVAVNEKLDAGKAVQHQVPFNVYDLLAEGDHGKWSANSDLRNQIQSSNDQPIVGQKFSNQILSLDIYHTSTSALNDLLAQPSLI